MVLVIPGNPYWRDRISTADLLLLTSLDQLIFKMNEYFPLLQIRYLNEEVNCTEPSRSYDVPFQLKVYCSLQVLQSSKLFLYLDFSIKLVNDIKSWCSCIFTSLLSEDDLIQNVSSFQVTFVNFFYKDRH
jgi:hypothetical protein